MKNGKHTTEFWLTLISICISVLVFRFTEHDWAVFLALGAIVSVYIYGRKAVKVSTIIHGDYVGGDSVEVDDIDNSEGVAVGSDAEVRTKTNS